ncbi:MAG: hypothetical protein IH571_04035, partial [Acholeplasmataceae bacterium]|nr:hypothetical protein [Acholeplasmataceae bacterium]
VQGMLPGIVQQLLERSAESAVFTMIPKTGKVQSFVGGVTGKDYQIVVLVNEESASAAEVLAASLKYYGGYEVYGIPTYGKGVYQNSIHLRDIQGVRYSLTYTEGEWFYDQGKNVAVDPIEVIEIIQSGIKMLDLPVYQGEVNYNSVSLSLVEYQHFLNYYYGLEGVSAIRTDGYLDTETRDLIAQFQSDEFLPITEKLDLLTARRIHEIFKTDHQNIDLDHQLQTLIAILKGDE